MLFLFVKQPKLVNKLAISKTLQYIKNTTGSFVMLKNVLLWRIMFLKEVSYFPTRLHFFDQKYYKNITIVKYHYNRK